MIKPGDVVMCPANEKHCAVATNIAAATALGG
jgi:hypothetical protein